MPSTIEVPISLIKAGDMAAIRELLPKENLFGRWATHPEYGRGIICSSRITTSGFVTFAYSHSLWMGGSGTEWSQVEVNDLTLDPAELTTLADFENAPEGTIVAAPTGNAFQKVSPERWENHLDLLDDKQMAISGPYKILRWGWGE